MLFHGLKKIWNPGIYQGKARMKAYFEGWYFKLVDASERETVAIIPGVSFDADGQNAVAFVQLLDTAGASSAYFQYGIDQFRSSSRTFEFEIGRNFFSSYKISVDAAQGAASMKGTLLFSGVAPWPVTLLSPGAMGWYAFVPFMECYHGVLSFDHTIEGTLNINGRCIDFTGGRGYMEKDWGRSFPRYHVWIQTNHFDRPGTSLMISIANIPWLRSYFNGFIAGLLHAGHLYRFATYTGAKLTLFRVEKDQLTVHICSDDYRLEVQISEQRGITLRAPVLGDMKGRLQESMTAKTRVRLVRYGKQREEVVFEGTGRNTGIEIAGNRDEIAAIQVRSKM
jgi:tocopherol cyclase